MKKNKDKAGINPHIIPTADELCNISEMWIDVKKEEITALEILRPSTTFAKDAMKRLFKNVTAIAAIIIISCMIIMSVVVPIISPYKYDQQFRDYGNLSYRLPVTQLDDGTLVHKTIELKLIKVSDDGRLLGLCHEIKDDIVTKNKYFDVNGTTYIISYDKTVSIWNEAKTWKYPTTKIVHNRTFPLGTDKLGRDMLVRLCYGGRISLSVALICAAVNIFVGVLYGGIAAYAGGVVEEIMVRIIDILQSVPMTLYVVLLMVAIGPGFRTIIIAMAAVEWCGTARMVRGDIKKIKCEDYIAAAKTIGVSDSKILLRHMVPNIIGSIIVYLTMQIPQVIFTEAFLSFIGLGIPAPVPSWGTMCEMGIYVFRMYPYQLFLPAGVITFAIVCFNFLGDGLRDAFDPRLKK